MTPAVGLRVTGNTGGDGGDGSFSLPQDDIDESADQRQREGNPRQDVGVAEGVFVRHPLRTHHRVDDGSAHHEQTCMGVKTQKLSDACAISGSLFSEEPRRLG